MKHVAAPARPVRHSHGALAVFTAVAILLGPSPAAAQPDSTLAPAGVEPGTRSPASSVVYGELGGAGLLSLNLDFIMSSRPGGHTSMRLGGGAVPFVGYPVVLGISYLKGDGGWMGEAGVSATIFLGEGEVAVLPLGSLGYRYHPRGRGLFFRIGLGAGFALREGGGGFILLPGISLGGGG